MVVRIRFPRGRLLRRQPGRNRQIALGFSALLTPISLMAYALGFWSLSSDMGIAREFGLSGFLAHWQVWIVVAVAFHVAGRALARYGAGQALRVPRVLTNFPGGAEEPAAEDRKERKRA